MTTLGLLSGLSQGDRKQALYQGLLGLGAQLSAAGAPTTDPGARARGWGASGQGFMQGVRGYAQDRQAAEMNALKKQIVEAQLAEQKRKERQARAVDAYAQMRGANTRPDGAGASQIEMLRGAYPELTAKAELEAMLPSLSKTPMSIKEWQAFQRMSPADQNKYLRMKRAQPPIDIGGSFASVDPLDPTVVTPIAPKTLKPGEEPSVRGEQAAAAAEGTAIGTELGETKARLSAALATYPKLKDVVENLSKLGKKASYTWAQRGKDALNIQLGGKASEGAVARAEYIATVKNNILPLLRQTFGAAFTAQEGESLLATLGDPNMHPDEKDAVLSSFIAQKHADILAMQRQVGGAKGSMKEKYGLK